MGAELFWKSAPNNATYTRNKPPNSIVHSLPSPHPKVCRKLPFLLCIPAIMTSPHHSETNAHQWEFWLKEVLCVLSWLDYSPCLPLRTSSVRCWASFPPMECSGSVECSPPQIISLLYGAINRVLFNVTAFTCSYTMPFTVLSEHMTERILLYHAAYMSMLDTSMFTNNNQHLSPSWCQTLMKLKPKLRFHSACVCVRSSLMPAGVMPYAFWWKRNQTPDFILPWFISYITQIFA